MTKPATASEIGSEDVEAGSIQPEDFHGTDQAWENPGSN